MRFLADENLNGRILRGLLREVTDVDVVRVQDVEIYMKPDPVVLDWAAKEKRILLTHDIETIPKFANERLARGLPMAGVILIRDSLPIGEVIEDLHIIIGASSLEDWENRVVFLPI
jgi:predicted nuclease of predicted toxin-antitoxin system